MITSSRFSSLLALVIALTGIAPIFFWIERFPQLVVVLALLIGLLQEWRGGWRFSNRQFNLALVPVFIWYLLQYSRSNPIQPVVSVLVIMLAARLVGEKSVRNLLQINLLSLICLASRSLYDLSPVFLMWLTVMMVLLPVSLVMLTFAGQNSVLLLGRRELTRIVGAALLITAATLPATALLFPVLPRTAFPMWQFLAIPEAAAPGMSDRVEPGSSASIGTSRTLAFRAELPRQPQPPYWRGTVFNRMNGNRWVRDAERATDPMTPTGQLVSLTIYPEPSPSLILITLDAPLELGLSRIRVTPDLVYELVRAPGKRFSYTVRAATDGLLRSKGLPRQLDQYLQVPAGLQSAFVQQGAAIRTKGANNAQRLQLVEELFSSGGFQYSRQGLPTGPDALYRFFFETKQGHCEFYASAAALLLRLAGVPSRLVGGYLGGEYNEIGGYYLVTEDRAHVWVEVYLEGKGWQRFDPSRFAVNADAVWQEPARATLGMRLRYLLDALDYRWNRAVVTYDFERQAEQIRLAARKLKDVERGLSWKQLIWAGGAVMVILAVWLLAPRIRQLHSPEQRLVRQLYRLMEKRYGLSVPVQKLGLFELAVQTGNPLVQQFADLYGAAVYHDRRLNPEELRQLRRLLQQLARAQQRP